MFCHALLTGVLVYITTCFSLCKAFFDLFLSFFLLFVFEAHNVCYGPYISYYLFIDASIALIKAARMPDSSRALTPLIVEPPGEVTLSLRIPG